MQWGKPSKLKKRLYVDMSPSANIMTFRVTMTRMTYDLDPCYRIYPGIFPTDRQTDRN